MFRLTTWHLAAMVASVLAAGCGDGETDPPPTPPPTAAVTVGNNLFRSDRNSTDNPAVDTVQAGGVVTWTWVQDALLHSVDSEGPPDFPDSELQVGPSYSYTFSTAGTYQYTCASHPGVMTGRIVVR